MSDEPQHPVDPTAEMLELLSFTLAGQDYAVNIMQVREIRNGSAPTPLPKTPRYVRGVINLRGTVLPVLDLAQRLEIDGAEVSDREVFIVLNDGGRLFGVAVDAVSDILTIPSSALQDPPAMGGSVQESCVKGLILDEERMIRVLAIDRLAPRADGTVTGTEPREASAA